MASRTLTESQYQHLVVYESGADCWLYGGPPSSLVAAGLLRNDRLSPSFYRITEAGRAALSAFRARYGLCGTCQRRI